MKTLLDDLLKIEYHWDKINGDVSHEFGSKIMDRRSEEQLCDSIARSMVDEWITSGVLKPAKPISIWKDGEDEDGQ